MWFEESLSNIKSLGSTTEKTGGLAGIAKQRKLHLGQFFTPEAIVDYVWNLLSPTIGNIEKLTGEVKFFDNSCGVGSLLRHARPEIHQIYGYDLHGESVKRLDEALNKHHFKSRVIQASLSEAKVGEFDIAIINPPFSVHLESPLLEPFTTNTFGKYGPKSSAMSHNYALEQALRACPIVAAILPANMESFILDNDHLNSRCKAIIKLPRDAFVTENANVTTIAAIFDASHSGQPLLGCIDTVKSINLSYKSPKKLPLVSKSRLISDKPSILTPVTGDNTVRICHNSRKIVLKFRCGLTEAKVLNGIYRDLAYDVKPEKHRLSKEIKYAGSGLLDIESYLVQKSPEEAFYSFVDSITKQGGKPVVDAGLVNHLKKRIKETRINTTALKKWVFVPSEIEQTHSEKFEAKANSHYRIYADRWGSPVIKAGEKVILKPSDVDHDTFTGEFGGQVFSINEKTLHDNFTISGNDENSEGTWKEAHKGLEVAFPELAKMYRKRAISQNIHKILSWEYQFDDLIEFCMRSVGSVVGWHMGTGKTYLGPALCKMGGKHNLIVTHSHLLEQYLEDMEGLGLLDEINVIRNPEDLLNLKQINITTYHILKSRLSHSSKQTYAHKLRRRVHTLVLDEGDILANPYSEQSRACQRVSAKKVFPLTGTPARNYPRNVHPLATVAVGNGTAEQPYGIHRSYLSSSHLRSCAYSNRGEDKVREDFCTFEWVTHKFEDDNIKGGKREIPVIKKPSLYREWVDTFVKRRIKNEPDCRKYIKVQDPDIQPPAQVEWDEGHLKHYIDVAYDFSQWFLNTYRKESGSSNNMIALLARIGAVETACNNPSSSSSGFKSYPYLTSKQRAVIDRATELVGKGHKVVVYAKSPDALNRLNQELSKQDVESIVFHGKRPINARNRDLNYFRQSDKPMVLLASFGVTECGLNIFQADRILMYNRCWSSKIEEQSIYRLIRPLQKNKVIVERFHLEGSIDEYMHQMCEFKQKSIQEGLDWGAPIPSDIKFEHLDAILDKFVHRILELRNIENVSELRQQLSLAA